MMNSFTYNVIYFENRGELFLVTHKCSVVKEFCCVYENIVFIIQEVYLFCMVTVCYTLTNFQTDMKNLYIREYFLE